MRAGSEMPKLAISGLVGETDCCELSAVLIAADSQAGVHTSLHVPGGLVQFRQGTDIVVRGFMEVRRVNYGGNSDEKSHE